MQIFKRTAAIAVCVVAMSSAACSSWAPPLPSSPSSLPSAMDSTPSAGATIQGHVQGATGAATTKLAGATPTFASLTSTVTLTVKVVGTSISAPVSSSGAFVLEGVPAGNIQLQFSGQTDNAVATLGSVNTGDRLDLEIRIQGSVGVVEASIHVKVDSTTEVEGDVTALSGTCPNLSFMVNGWTLKINSSSQASCSNIKVGVKVKIKGTLTSSRVVVVVRLDVTATDEHHTDNNNRRPGHDGDDDDDEDDD